MTLTKYGVIMNQSEIPFDIQGSSVYCCGSRRSKIKGITMISIHFLAVSLPEESYILSGRKISNSINIFLLSDRLSRRSI